MTRTVKETIAIANAKALTRAEIIKALPKYITEGYGLEGIYEINDDNVVIRRYNNCD